MAQKWRFSHRAKRHVVLSRLGRQELRRLATVHMHTVDVLEVRVTVGLTPGGAMCEKRSF